MNGAKSPRPAEPIFRRSRIDMLKDFLEGKPLGHPIHPMLVHFPIGLFFLSLLLDIASFVFPNVPNLVLASFYAISLGLIAALLAAVPGFADYTDIRRDHPAKRIATAHMILNLFLVTLYVINLAVRFSADVDLKVHPLAFLLSLVGVALLSISGYLGGRLVYDDGIAVGRHKRHMPTPRETIHLTAPILCADSVLFPIMGAQMLCEGDTIILEYAVQVMSVSMIVKLLYA